MERLFADTLRGGDFRAREAGCMRLAELSGGIIDQCVAQGCRSPASYGGTLASRSFGGALVSRTFYARGQTGQQLLYGATAALLRQVAAGRITLLPRRDLLELVTVDGVARGVVARHLLTGALEVHTAQAVLLATGGYSNVFFSPPTPSSRTPRRSGAPTARGPCWPTPASPRSTPPASPAAIRARASSR